MFTSKYNGTCQSHNIDYCLTCKTCGLQYVGMTLETESFRNASDNISATSETQTCVTLLPNTLTSQVITMTQEMWNPTFFPLLPSQVIPARPWPWDSSLSYSGFFAYATWSEFHGLINQSRHVSCHTSPVEQPYGFSTCLYFGVSLIVLVTKDRDYLSNNTPILAPLQKRFLSYLTCPPL